MAHRVHPVERAHGIAYTAFLASFGTSIACQTHHGWHKGTWTQRLILKGANVAAGHAGAVQRPELLVAVDQRTGLRGIDGWATFTQAHIGGQGAQVRINARAVRRCREPTTGAAVNVVAVRLNDASGRTVVGRRAPRMVLRTRKRAPLRPSSCWPPALAWFPVLAPV